MVNYDYFHNPQTIRIYYNIYSNNNSMVLFSYTLDISLNLLIAFLINCVSFPIK